MVRLIPRTFGVKSSMAPDCFREPNGECHEKTHHHVAHNRSRPAENEYPVRTIALFIFACTIVRTAFPSIRTTAAVLAHYRACICSLADIAAGAGRGDDTTQ